MPFEIVRNDIVHMHVDAIVNTANPRTKIGMGVDSRIHEKAGPQLLEARRKIGDLQVSEAAVTPGFKLPAKYVIHVCGPVWEDGMHGEEEALAACYRNALNLAKENSCRSVAFPLISAGNYGFPRTKALSIAVGEISRFLMEEEMQVYLVVYEKEAVAVSEKLFASVRSFIDEHYIEERRQYEAADYDGFEEYSIRRPKDNRRREMPHMSRPAKETGAAAPSASGLKRFLEKKEKGFSETLLSRIDASGLTDAEEYKKATISRKHFSKIRSNPDYKPSRNTVIAFAFALEMPLDETKKFLATAGYALSRSSISDVIVEYFLLTKNYDLYELNEVLFLYDQPLIGNVS